MSRNHNIFWGRISSGDTCVNFSGEAIPVRPLEVETPFEWHRRWSDGTQDLQNEGPVLELGITLSNSLTHTALMRPVTNTRSGFYPLCHLPLLKLQGSLESWINIRFWSVAQSSTLQPSSLVFLISPGHAIAIEITNHYTNRMGVEVYWFNKWVRRLWGLVHRPHCAIL